MALVNPMVAFPPPDGYGEAPCVDDTGPLIITEQAANAPCCGVVTDCFFPGCSKPIPEYVDVTWTTSALAIGTSSFGDSPQGMMNITPAYNTSGAARLRHTGSANRCVWISDEPAVLQSMPFTYSYGSVCQPYSGQTVAVPCTRRIAWFFPFAGGTSANPDGFSIGYNVDIVDSITPDPCGVNGKAAVTANGGGGLGISLGSAGPGVVATISCAGSTEERRASIAEPSGTSWTQTVSVATCGRVPGFGSPPDCSVKPGVGSAFYTQRVYLLSYSVKW